MSSLDRVSETNLRGSVDSALQQVNHTLETWGVGYQVASASGKELEAKSPIFLELRQGDEKTPIGITHFAHLTENFEEAPFEEVARTVDELAGSILKAVIIHESLKNVSKVLITSVGTPFYNGGLHVEIQDGILFVEGRQITYNGNLLPAYALCGEEGLTFVQAGNGDFAASNPIDQRLGKRIFFDKDSGALYRS